MADLIERSAVLHDLETLWDYATVDGITASTILRQVMTDVRNAPTVDAIPIGEEFWMDRFNIRTRNWRDADGNLMGVSFVITRKEAEDERPDKQNSGD